MAPGVIGLAVMLHTTTFAVLLVPKVEMLNEPVP
jgi:hypothetical protein